MTMLTSCLEPVFAVDVLSCSWMNYTKLTVDKPLTLLCFSSYIVYVHCSKAFSRMRVEISSYIVYVQCSKALSRMRVEISSYIVYVQCSKALSRMRVEISSYIVHVHCSEAFTRIRVEFSIKITILLYYLQTNWTYCRYNVIRLSS